MTNEEIQVPKGRNFADVIRTKIQQDRETAEKGYQFCPPLLDKADLGIRLWRFDKGSRRYYYDPDGGYFFPSQTTVQDATMKTSPFIFQWIDDMGGLDNAREYRDERAWYGTLMHLLFTEALFMGALNLEHVRSIVMDYRAIHELWHIDVKKWIPELKADLSAFAQWVHDHNIEPVALEIPITYPISEPWSKKELLWLAGTVDLVAYADIERKGNWGAVYKSGKKKGQPKETKKTVRELIVVDYKSGKKGFYKSNEVQVDQYMKGFNHACKRKGIELEAVSCWNFAPKDSTGDKPTYTFTEQTEKQMAKYMPYLTSIFMLDGLHEVSDVREVQGELVMGEPANDNVLLVSASDYMAKAYEIEKSIYEEMETQDTPEKPTNNTEQKPKK